MIREAGVWGKLPDAILTPYPPFLFVFIQHRIKKKGLWSLSSVDACCGFVFCRFTVLGLGTRLHLDSIFRRGENAWCAGRDAVLFVKMIAGSLGLMGIHLEYGRGGRTLSTPCLSSSQLQPKHPASAPAQSPESHRLCSASACERMEGEEANVSETELSRKGLVVCLLSLISPEGCRLGLSELCDLQCVA